jgi:glucans biosynthesis protein C
MGSEFMITPANVQVSPEFRPFRPPSRLAWVDNLRTLMILLVVNMHATVTYSHVGGWYIKEAPEPAIETKLIFLVWQGHLQAFFMGLLFFVSAYFAELSLRKRGPAVFLKERLVRLGIPLLLYVLFIHPFVVYVLNPWGAKFPPIGTAYWEYLSSGHFLFQTGPLWFAEALLIFCFGLVAFHRFAAKATSQRETNSAVGFSGWHALGIAALLAVTSFLVRTVQPIGTNVQNLQLCFFPQYIVFFACGVWVARRGSLESIARLPMAARAGWIALVCGPIALVTLLFVMRPYLVPKVEAPIMGGWNPFALGYATWEQFAGVGLSLGAMALVSRLWSRSSALSEWLSARSFGVYVLHTPVLVGLTILFRGYSQNPYFNVLLLTASSLVATFILTDLLRRIPGVSRVI